MLMWTTLGSNKIALHAICQRKEEGNFWRAHYLASWACSVASKTVKFCDIATDYRPTFVDSYLDP